MKILTYLPVLLFAVTFIGSCSKEDEGFTRGEGTIIGTNPCTARYTENKERGYVLKIVHNDAGSGAVITDTVLTYNLPDVFNIPKEIFPPRAIDYLFPEEYRDKYHFEFTYKELSPDNYKLVGCTADVFTGSMWEATNGGRQIVVGGYFKVHP